jgi:hypothetical protein
MVNDMLGPVQAERPPEHVKPVRQPRVAREIDERTQSKSKGEAKVGAPATV